MPDSYPAVLAAGCPRPVRGTGPSETARPRVSDRPASGGSPGLLNSGDAHRSISPCQNGVTGLAGAVGHCEDVPLAPPRLPVGSIQVGQDGVYFQASTAACGSCQRYEAQAGLVAGREYLQPLVQAGDPQDLRDERLGRDEAVTAACCFGLVGDPDEGTQPACVAEGQAGQIEEQ